MSETCWLNDDCIAGDHRDEPCRFPSFSNDFEGVLDKHLAEAREMMISRHKKYGPGNIAEFGELGLLVRLSDKMARLKNNQDDFSDESVDDTVRDVLGYSLIWLLVRAGDWPEV